MGEVEGEAEKYSNWMKEKCTGTVNLRHWRENVQGKPLCGSVCVCVTRLWSFSD